MMMRKDSRPLVAREETAVYLATFTFIRPEGEQDDENKDTSITLVLQNDETTILHPPILGLAATDKANLICFIPIHTNVLIQTD